MYFAMLAGAEEDRGGTGFPCTIAMKDGTVWMPQ